MEFNESDLEGGQFMELEWKFEKGKVIPLGKMVTVNNHKMHIYINGGGANTLIFMSGGGTCCPTLDFKPLWMRLCSQFTIAVVEKAGYGWSEEARVPRDINTILDETRTALLLAELPPPYVLMPHSLSGIEALAWAKRYPDEVKAIIGLDAAIPIFYNQITPIKSTMMTTLYHLLLVIKSLGLLRFATTGSEKTIRACGQFSEQEIEIYKYMFIHNSFTRNMLDEVKLCRENAKDVANLGYPKSIPYLSFISDGKEVGVSNWREYLMNFISEMDNGKYILLDCGHYIYHYESQMIALETKKFIFNL